MSQPRRCAALAAGAAAAALCAAPAFTAAPGAGETQVSSLRGYGQVRGPAAASGNGQVASVAVAAAGVLALGAAAARGRQQKVARAGVLTKDDQGRFRFDAPETPLIPEEQPGVTMPLGFFDPLGFTKSGLMTFPGDSTGFKHLRTAEIKHGRFAMMASTGSLFAHFVKFPGFEDVPTGLKALDTAKGAEGFAFLVFLIAGHEAVTWKPQKGEPGSFGDPFEWKQFTPEMRSKEINNGRMAMFAVMGQIVAELQTGKGPVEQFFG
mmetsp:Transcript_15223/g.28663  ORF Transcript_15223/g.28663 Transcript_15223/m.28663 type:complete len:265 (-) Transcript_15223:52-846(-)